MNSSDPRFSLAAWMRYEPTIEAWLAAYPAAFVFFPKTLSVETTLARIRDAVKAKLHFNYPSTIDSQTLSKAWETVVVSRSKFTKDAVRIGPKEGRNLIQVGAEHDPTSTPERRAMTVLHPTLDDLLALAHLLNRGILTTEVQILECDSQIRQTFMEKVVDFHNVAVNTEQNAPDFTLF